ncbi:MAG: hypothetical protein CSA62_01070 [Planctomycetota bacterium]|nr:MAG: hypothetical protein CSA62_01070 [Planctomycetota bacterium]
MHFSLPLLALGMLASSVASQIAPLPAAGDAYAGSSGVSLSVTFVQAKTGLQRFELLLNQQIDGPGSTVSIIRSRRGSVLGKRYHFKSQVLRPGIKPFAFVAELDVYPEPATKGYRFIPRIKQLPKDYAVEALGVGYVLEDRPGIQKLLVPVFGGAEFDDPVNSISNKRLDTGFAHSIQQTAYYAADGSGLLIRAEDPSGTQPKRFLYEVDDSGPSKRLRISLDYWLPDTHVGGIPRQGLAAILVQPYRFDPNIEEGWYRAAKLYRKWISKAGRRPGSILERGPLQQRRDVPKWIKELDLFVYDQFGWFPDNTLVPKPLLSLERHKQGLGAKNIFVGLWSWSDRSSPTGYYGSWFARPEVSSQIRALRKKGIRVSGYTFPQAFDKRNPFLNFWLLRDSKLEDRSGKPVEYQSNIGEPWVTMDVASIGLSVWFAYLSRYHAAVTGLNGMYMDLPVSAGTPDFKRPWGQQEGTSRLGYQGFQRILQYARLGASFAGQEFALYHEAAFEWLISSANFGQGAIDLYGRANPTKDDSRGVPYFQAVYSGYTSFWPADPGLGTQTTTINPFAYGPFDQFNISRLQAEGVVLGGYPNTSEVFMPSGQLFYEHVFGDPLLDNWLQHHKQVLKSAIALRQAARPWLVYGEMLNDPRIGGDSDPMLLSIYYLGIGNVPESYTKPRVHTRAWKAPDSSIRVLAFNGHKLAGTTKLDLARIGKPKARGLRDSKTRQFFPAVLVGGRRVVTVPVGSAKWRILEPR